MSLTKMSLSDLAIQHFDAMTSGDATLAERCIAEDYVNQMAVDEPPACREAGVPGFMATSAWLRFAFADLHFEVLDLAHEGEVTLARVRMSGRQTGPFVVFPAGQKRVALPPTGRQFAVEQVHRFVTAGDRHVHHLAVRDDFGMLTQLGHLPPSPAVAARLARWHVSGAARRAVRRATEVAEAAARAGDPAA